MKITQLCFTTAPGSSICFKAGKAAASMSFWYRNLCHHQPFASHGYVRDTGLLRSWHILRFQSLSRQKQLQSFLHLHLNLPLLLRTSAWGTNICSTPRRWHWVGVAWAVLSLQSQMSAVSGREPSSGRDTALEPCCSITRAKKVSGIPTKGAAPI